MKGINMEELFNKEALERVFKPYSALVLSTLDYFKVNTPLIGDHLGSLAHSPEEFDNISRVLLDISQQINEVELHGRRVRIFKLHKPLEANGILMPKIEIFEPKDSDDLKKLRYGIEHISFYVPKYDEVLTSFKTSFEFVKEGQFNDSKFAKTDIINNVEIEFRSDMLGEEDT